MFRTDLLLERLCLYMVHVFNTLKGSVETSALLPREFPSTLKDGFNRTLKEQNIPHFGPCCIVFHDESSSTATSNSSEGVKQWPETGNFEYRVACFHFEIGNHAEFIRIYYNNAKNFACFHQCIRGGGGGVNVHKMRFCSFQKVGWWQNACITMTARVSFDDSGFLVDANSREKFVGFKEFRFFSSIKFSVCKYYPAVYGEWVIEILLPVHFYNWQLWFSTTEHFDQLVNVLTTYGIYSGCKREHSRERKRAGKLNAARSWEDGKHVSKVGEKTYTLRGYS